MTNVNTIHRLRRAQAVFGREEGRRAAPNGTSGWRDVRYGICNWLERFDGASGRTLAASAPGVFGFCPWIDFEDNIVGVLAAQSGMEKAFPVYLELKALIKELGIARQQGGFHDQ